VTVSELIVALDLPDAPAAVALLDRLPDGVAVKVGSVLATAAGSGFVRNLAGTGHPVFLDLKWHDIPNTVAGAVRAARALGVEMVTVHALGGDAMLRAAMEAAAGDVKVVAVTVLTSHTDVSLGAVLGRPSRARDEVERLATLAMGAGVDGVVCSPLEIEVVQPIVGGGRIVVPGIRRGEDATGDQARVATPGAAAAAGATHLVVGRPIIEAEDPSAAYAAFLGETATGDGRRAT
jgi:orotidine-5'-phosphate decarboxylase